MTTQSSMNQLQSVAQRISEMRQIMGYTYKEMAEMTEVSEETYRSYETGTVDLPFTFIHKCAKAFGLELTDILEGHSAKLSGYTVTRRGEGLTTASEDGITIQDMAPLFRKKLATPYWVTYEYSEELQKQPIHTVTHAGQEFDMVVKGSMRIRIGDREEVLREGDSVFFKSSTPHGMIAVGGEDCVFLAMIMASDATDQPMYIGNGEHTAKRAPLLCEKFVKTTEDEHGVLTDVNYENEEKYNFAFDTVDEIARRQPDKLAMVHVSNDMTERRFTFKDFKDASSQSANYFKSLGIKRGDRVMLVLKRHYQFWYAILGLHKLGAIAIPATNQLVEKDFTYRFNAAGVSAILCTADGDTARQVELAEKAYGKDLTKVLVGGKRDGWHDFDSEYSLFSRRFIREDDAPCGSDPMLMLFTSGTTGYPKMAMHSYKYALGHFVTAKYWHLCEQDGLHFTISETGWGKALWGKLYGQWLCEGAVFTYDFDRFDSEKILPMFKKYGITTFCAPPTMYRMLIKQDLSKYDLTSIRHATTAGEALNPEVYYQFEKATGLHIAEGFGQTEMTLGIANLYGTQLKPGAMGKPVPGYGIDLVDTDGNPVPDGVNGEIVIRTDKKVSCGVFLGYYLNKEATDSVWHDGMYHTGDLAWRDEDGYYWYVGRADDVIKSSGYRIGPFEIESTIMELPYVLECGVCAAPDEVRGQVVKACVVLVPGTNASDELKKEIQDYVKSRTAPYKYPRIVEFRTELPKTISGKIMRNKL
ncbi:MAG: cupin domain-containing protein [Ruminococcaceae bacterium]|nr:cupin domain-containing protein [Oscillospiraceae bacterium]